MFLEVTDSRAGVADWSCFVSHRLAVVNQRQEDRSVAKESQNRYSKAAKDWGWREFVTLTSLFDQDSGFLVQDTVVFSAEVLILKESSFLFEYADEGSGSPAGLVGVSGSGGGGGGGGSGGGAAHLIAGGAVDVTGANKIAKRGVFTWKVENFLAFKEIMETRKIFSKFFCAGGCDLRIGEWGGRVGGWRAVVECGPLAAENPILLSHCRLRPVH